VARATWWGWLAGELPDASDRWLFGDRFGDDANRANARRTTDHALRLIRQLQAQPAPYYLFVHYMDPHDPYLPPPDSGCDAGRQRPAHAAAPEHADWRRLQRIARDLRSGEPSAEQARAQVKALYDGEVRYVDRALGELLEQVEHGGRPTIVLLTADHGEQFGDHGLMTHGDSVYEAGLRVPFMLAGPGVPVRRLSHPPHLIDVAPTLLALAGLDRSGLPGLDLSREIPTARPHLARAGPHAALRDAQGFKLLLELDGRGEPGRLYALGSDPAELHDLRRDQPGRFARLERELRSRARPSQPAPRDPGEEHLSALRALGYVE
jgi:arylsulfatase A-like enzyme